MNPNFETGPDGVERAEDSVIALFPVVVERRDRRQFQAEGHFVCGLRDENGFSREWIGSEIFIGTIFLELKDAEGNVTDRRQMIRIEADSILELRRILSVAIKDSFYAWWHAQQVQASTYMQFRDANQSGIEFKNWLAEMMPAGVILPDARPLDLAMSRIQLLLDAGRKGTQEISKLEDRIVELEALVPWWSRRRAGL